ncbi:MAG TPA: UDP-N-acetylmuramoyl-L-alanine--D-glutamate ligase [Phycisphaerae bacterium]|nr:UDP-N-acetylmuramoyl-L-alanine--D-glutamate ligase [Candidatus Brocadiaceae bacterium]HOI55915.1 UDP-N-acetylmuramoyl-L-alanine--D-glutamate ligase [Phycisphaerae bacterium]
MDLVGRRVTVMGLGRFGGGLGAVLHLLRRGAAVTVTDLKTADQLQDSLRQLQGQPVTLHLGGHASDDFTQADLVVVNPAVPKNAPMLDVARRAGVPLTTEINLFVSECAAPVLAVTGSAGKSTTVSLLARALATRYTTHLGGNIGRSLLDLLDGEPGLRAEDRVCLELSSFQLEDTASLGWSPHVAVVTNLAPNHLDHHGTMEAYAEAKLGILRFQATDDWAVLPAADGASSQWDRLVAGWDRRTQARTVRFSVTQSLDEGAWLDGGDCVLRLDGVTERVPLASALRLPGRHNAANFLAAALAARCEGVPLAESARAAAEFAGLPHRLSLVAEVGGVGYWNDSKATTPAAAEVALGAFDRPVIAIAGGYDKKIDLGPLADALARGARAVLLIGQTAPMLAELLAERHYGGAETVETLDRAVARAAELAQPGDVVLLSPGHASWGQFENYEQRGDRFAEYVRALRGAEVRA